MLSSYVNGKRKRKTVPEGTDAFKEMLRRELLSRKLAALEGNCSVLEYALNNLQDHSDDCIADEIQQRFSVFSKRMLAECFFSLQADGWESEAYEKLDYHEEAKRHMTSKGLLVRSKSELLIAEKLYEYKLPFRYEQIIHVGTYALAPDFTIKRADGKLFYWEHEGLTNSESYLEWQNKKSRIYAGIGIVPWDNLIVSYDDINGNIDLRILRSEIENRLVI